MRMKKHDTYRKSFPYYKVQYWNAKVYAWQDIQRSFPTKATATKYGQQLGIKYRIMEVQREGRKVI